MSETAEELKAQLKKLSAQATPPAAIAFLTTERSCVSENDVTPWMIVAAITAPSRGRSKSVRRLPITSSIRNFVDAGRTSPDTRLIAMRTKPKARIPLRGATSALMSGRSARSRSDFGSLGRSSRTRPTDLSAPGRRPIGFFTAATDPPRFPRTRRPARPAACKLR